MSAVKNRYGDGMDPAAASPEPRSRLSKVFSFPNPVNEVSARLVAAGVVVTCVAAITLQQRFLLLVIAYGFVARVLTGPTLSPLAQLVTRVITPRLKVTARFVAGPPKRFAQGIGVAFSGTAVVLAYGFARPHAAYGVLVALVVAASLEAFAGLCLGCHVFKLLIRAGLIPAEVCEACADFTRVPRPVPSPSNDPR